MYWPSEVLLNTPAQEISAILLQNFSAGLKYSYTPLTLNRASCYISYFWEQQRLLDMNFLKSILT